MAGEELQRDSSAPQILAALQKLQAELTATRADVRTLSERQGAGGTTTAEGQSGVSEEVQRTTGALNEEAAARERNITVARNELIAQRAITAEVERTWAAYAKLTETHGTGGVPSTSKAEVAQAQAQVAAQARLSTVSAPLVVPAPASVDVAAKGTPALAGYGEELTNVSARQAEFAAAQIEGGAANARFTSQLLKGEVTLGEFGANLATTAGKFAQWTAAAGGVFAVIGIFDEVYKGARDSASGVEQLKRSLQGVDSEKAQSDFRQLAQELNIPIKEASDAVFGFSRAFPTLEDSVAAAGVGLRALKVDGVALTASTPALIAVHQQFGVTATGLAGVFDMLDEGQRRYAGRVTNTIQVLQKSTAAVKDAGGSLEGLIQLSTLASRLTGQPGNQVGTAFYRAASNTVQNPTNQALIRNLGLNPEEASHEFTNFLKTAIKLAAGKSGDWQRELAIAVGGKQQGGKIFEPLFSGGASGVKLLEEIEAHVTPSKARGSTDAELTHILEQTDERVKSLKNSLQQLGDELQRTGATAGLGLVLLTVTDTLKVTNDLLDAFNVLPHPVKELIVVLLEAKLAMAALQATALGAGVANKTGLAFLGPSPAQQASRAERAAQESALASVTGLQGSTLVREQQLRTQALVNQQQIAMLAEEEAAATSSEERVAIKARIAELDAEATALTQQANLLLSEQVAQQAVADGLRARINALQAGALPAAAGGASAAAGGAAAAAGRSGAASEASTTEVAALVGGTAFAKFAALPELISSGLSLALKGFGVGILAEVAAQIGGATIGGGVGNKISGAAGAIGIGAAIGSIVPGVGTAVGAAGGAAFSIGQDLGSAIFGGYTRKEEEALVEKKRAEAARRHIEQVAGENRLRRIPTGLSPGIRELAEAEAQEAKPFNTYEGIERQNPKQAKETIATAALKATTTGATPADLKTLTEELDQLAGQFAGGEDKEGLGALQEAESKLLEASKKNAQDLADKAKGDPNLKTKETAYRAAVATLRTAAANIQASYRALVLRITGEREALTRLEAETNTAEAQNAARPGSVPKAAITRKNHSIDELKRTIEANQAQLAQVKRATEYETNQLALAAEQQAEGAFSELANTIDTNAGLAEAKTSDKTAQLRDALRADNEKLRLAAELFGKHSTQYKKALTEMLKQQQAIVEDAVNNIDVQGKLESSEIKGSGPDATIQRAQSNVDTLRKELGTLVAGHADPNKIKQTQTQINEAETSLASNVQSRATQLAQLEGSLAQANDQGNAIAQANDAAATASRLLALAQSPEERLQAQTALVQAANQLQQAEEARIAELGELTESTELNPIEHDRTKLRTDRRRLAKAKGPDEQLRDKAQVNADLIKFQQDQRGEAEEIVSFNLSMGKISTQQAVDTLQKLLKGRDISRQERRRLESEIYKLQNENGLDFGLGAVKAPNLYDAITRGGRTLPASVSVTALHQPPQLHQTNHITLSILGADPRAVIHELEREFGSLTRAQLRSAGL